MWTAGASQRGPLVCDTKVWPRNVPFAINLTLGYDDIRDRSKQGRQPPGPQERRDPQEKVGQEGIRPPDAGMGQARRQAEGQWQNKAEGEVNRGYLQAWGSVLVQVHVAGSLGAGVDETGQ